MRWPTCKVNLSREATAAGVMSAEMAVVPEGATAESRLDHQLNLFRRGAPPGSVQDIHRRVAAQNLTEQFGGRCSPRYVSVRQASSCAADAKRPFCLEPGTSKLHLDKSSCRCRFRVEDLPVARPHKQVSGGPVFRCLDLQLEAGL